MGLLSKIKAIFGKSYGDDAFYEELEDLLIEADMGGSFAYETVLELQKIEKEQKLKTPEDIVKALKNLFESWVKETTFNPLKDKLSLYLILGVNGVGKTTSIAKMASYYKKNNTKNIVLAAGDTFRAGAIDQLKIQGERVGVRVVAQKSGADPSAVIFDTIDSADKKGENLILADTAGRLPNRTNLVAELQKIDRITKKRVESLGNKKGEYKKILVVDSTTGQNGLQQAESFHEAVGVDGIVLTKYDSSSKGGVGIAIGKKLNLPIIFLGVGEGLDDLKPFDKKKYINEVLER